MQVEQIIIKLVRDERLIWTNDIVCTMKQRYGVKSAVTLNALRALAEKGIIYSCVNGAHGVVIIKEV